jgi:hypothetical protein
MTISRRPTASVSSLLLLLASACTEGPVAPPQADEAAPLPLLSEIRCTAVPARGEISCQGQNLVTDGSGPRTTQILVGGQHRYVRLTSGTPAVAGIVISFDVSVQNLLQQPLATTDGTVAHAAGVRVFFASLSGSGGSGEVSVVNATGTDMFTAAGQPYIQYGGTAGSQLGGDGILSSGETSAARSWQIDFGTHQTISFTVYVAAEVPTAAGAYLRFTQVSAGALHS